MASIYTSVKRVTTTSFQSSAEKLACAEQLLAQLRLSASSTSSAAVPSTILSHCFQQLADWVCTSLVKGALKECHDGNWWQLFALTIGSQHVRPSHSFPVSLLRIATTACQNVGAADQSSSALLGSGLCAVLKLLGTKFQLSFRPPLDTTVSLLEAAIQAALKQASPSLQQCDEGACSAWVQLVQQLLDSFLVDVAHHPNQRKVHAALTSCLLSPLLHCAFPHRASHLASCHKLMNTARALLASVLFHSTHFSGLAEHVSTSSIATLQLQGAASKHTGGNVAGCGGAQNGAAVGAAADVVTTGSKHSTYHQGVLQALDRLLGSHASQESTLAALPWLLTTFSAHLKQYLKSAAADLAEAASSKGKVVTTTGDGTGPSEGAGGESGHVGSSTSFHLLVQLALLLVNRMKGSAGKGAVGYGVGDGDQLERPSKRGRKNAADNSMGTKGVAREAGGSTDWQVLAAGLAQLLEAAKVSGVYRPTSDVGGVHRHFLEQLAGQVLGSCPEQQGGACVSAAAVMTALLQLEHKSVAVYMEQLWSLAWKSAATASLIQRGQAAAMSGLEAAAHMASSLVLAFGELRQLNTLLSALITSLIDAPDTHACNVICHPVFLEALQKAIRGIPSGQRVGLISFMKEVVQRLPMNPKSSNGAVEGPTTALSEVCCCCLQEMVVDLMSAPALAAAIEDFLWHALAPHLLPQLQEFPHDAPVTATSTAFLQLLLSLYSACIRLHAVCAAHHPEVKPLPGQSTDLSTIMLGHFSALVPPPGSDDVSTRSINFKSAATSMLPHYPFKQNGISSASQHSPGQASAPLTLALVACGCQQVQVLSELAVRLQGQCEVIREDADELGGDEEDGGARVAAEHRARLLPCVEREAREVAEWLLSVLGEPTDELLRALRERGRWEGVKGRVDGTELQAVVLLQMLSVLPCLAPWCSQPGVEKLMTWVFKAVTFTSRGDGYDIGVRGACRGPARDRGPSQLSSSQSNGDGDAALMGDVGAADGLRASLLDDVAEGCRRLLDSGQYLEVEQLRRVWVRVLVRLLGGCLVKETASTQRQQGSLQALLREGWRYREVMQYSEGRQALELVEVLFKVAAEAADDAGGAAVHSSGIYLLALQLAAAACREQRQLSARQEVVGAGNAYTDGSVGGGGDRLHWLLSSGQSVATRCAATWQLGETAAVVEALHQLVRYSLPEGGNGLWSIDQAVAAAQQILHPFAKSHTPVAENASAVTWVQLWLGSSVAAGALLAAAEWPTMQQPCNIDAAKKLEVQLKKLQQTVAICLKQAVADQQSDKHTQQLWTPARAAVCCLLSAQTAGMTLQESTSAGDLGGFEDMHSLIPAAWSLLKPVSLHAQDDITTATWQETSLQHVVAFIQTTTRMYQQSAGRCPVECGQGHSAATQPSMQFRNHLEAMAATLQVNLPEILTAGAVSADPAALLTGQHASSHPGTAGMRLMAALVSSLEVLLRSCTSDEVVQMYDEVHILLRERLPVSWKLSTLIALLVLFENPSIVGGLRLMSHHTPRLCASVCVCINEMLSDMISSMERPAAAACFVVAARCIESVLAREVALQLPPSSVPQMLALTITALQNLVLGCASTTKQSDSITAATVTASSRMFVAASRHRQLAFKRSMPSVVWACRCLSSILTKFTKQPNFETQALRRCASELARVYMAIAEQPSINGILVSRVLADYINWYSLQHSPAADEASACGEKSLELMRSVRQGALALYSVLSSRDLQHIHVVMGRGADGVRRMFLLELRREFEKNKYEGKV